MTLEKLQSEMIQAMKNHDKLRKSVLSGIVDAVKKASMTSKGRVEITEQLVDEVLLKYKKMVQEQIDTCPADRTELLAKYTAEMAVVKEFAPQLITDPVKIKNAIQTVLNAHRLEATKQNKGQIMKIISPLMKGQADMKIVNQVVTEMLV